MRQLRSFACVLPFSSYPRSPSECLLPSFLLLNREKASLTLPILVLVLWYSFPLLVKS